METANDSHHGHHKISAAIFVGSLIIGAAIVLAAELTKPPRYEYQAFPSGGTYLIYDNETGRAAEATPDMKLSESK
jgi:hypothetical protein